MPVDSERTSKAQWAVRKVRRAALGRALAAARTEAGMSQSQAAEASGTSRATISRLELGTSSISSDALWELASALGTTPAALFERAQADETVRALGEPSRKQ